MHATVEFMGIQDYFRLHPYLKEILFIHSLSIILIINTMVYCKPGVTATVRFLRCFCPIHI